MHHPDTINPQHFRIKPMNDSDGSVSKLHTHHQTGKRDGLSGLADGRWQSPSFLHGYLPRLKIPSLSLYPYPTATATTSQKEASKQTKQLKKTVGLFTVSLTYRPYTVHAPHDDVSKTFCSCLRGIKSNERKGKSIA